MEEHDRFLEYERRRTLLSIVLLVIEYRWETGSFHALCDNTKHEKMHFDKRMILRYTFTNVVLVL